MRGGEHSGGKVITKHYLEQALAIYHELGDQVGESYVIGNLDYIAMDHGDYARAGDYYQQTLRTCRQVGDRPGAAEALAYQSLLAHQLGDDAAARKYGQEALSIAQELGDPMTQALALNWIGHALVGLNQLVEAARFYEQAVEIWRERGSPIMATEPLAGLACVCVGQGDLAQAQIYVEQILSHLEPKVVEALHEPFWVYLTCYQILHTNGDPRAPKVLTAAYNLLQEQATKIDDGELRRSFLENVAANREIVEAWEGVK